MNNKALVVIDIQNDITKHYRDIIGNINAAIEWATAEGMHVDISILYTFNAQKSKYKGTGAGKAEQQRMSNSN